ncbi:hypothetical protein CC2G_001419 [Coprinopsis cinerea AmutBmut pab1-1]|nr:hypothetical protein CC2G_001419 [Coprinopsis cinerea AmutBmut pab1-1]
MAEWLERIEELHGAMERQKAANPIHQGQRQRTSALKTQSKGFQQDVFELVSSCYTGSAIPTMLTVASRRNLSKKQPTATACWSAGPFSRLARSIDTASGT